MTLIAALKPDTRVMLLGDILISEVADAVSPLSPFEPTFLPSIGLTVAPDPAASSQIVATRQKLVTITNNLAIGWAGEYSVARRLVRAMRDYFPPGSGPVTLHDIEAFFTTCDYNDLYRSQIGLVGFHSDDRITQGFRAGKTTDVDLPIFNRGSLAGSGVDFFVDSCRLLASQGVVFPPPNPEEADSATIANGLFLIGWLTAYEMYDHVSIHQHHIGGFYELMLRKGAAGFDKIGNVLFTYSQFIRDKQNKSRADFYPLIYMKMDYRGDVLFVRRISIIYHPERWPTLKDETLIVPPIYRELLPEEVLNEPLIDMNAQDYCHILFIAKENEPYDFLIMPDIRPDIRPVEIIQEKDRIGFSWQENFFERLGDPLREKGILVPKDS